MIRSMTGYGEAERDTPAGRLRVEIKTVNHRYFSANVRMPSALDRFEPQVREWLRVPLTRGHVNIALRLEVPGAAGDGEMPLLRLDEPRARAYVALLRQMKDSLGLAGEVDVALLSGFSDLIVRGDGEPVEIAAEDVQAVVEQAAQPVIRMRL